MPFIVMLILVAARNVFIRQLKLLYIAVRADVTVRADRLLINNRHGRRRFVTASAPRRTAMPLVNAPSVRGPDRNPLRDARPARQLKAAADCGGLIYMTLRL